MAQEAEPAVAMSASESADLTPDSVFDLLSNHRRRMVLYYLRQNRGAVGVQELAAEVASIENDVEVDELTNQQRKRVYVSLYQTHLPKMAEMGIIEYDKEGGAVSLSDKSDIDRYLTSGSRSTYPWTIHNLVLGVVGGLLLLATLLDAPFFGGVSTTVVLGTLLVVFAVSIVIQAWHVWNQEDEIPSELRRYD